MSDKDMAVRMMYGELRVDIVAEGVSYSSDVADDMVNNCLRAFRELWTIAGDYAVEAADEDDADVEAPAADDD